MIAARPLILIVEDDPDLRDTVQEILEEAGYRVWTAEHGAAALERLGRAQERPALVLLDLMMPVMDGWTFRAELEGLPRTAGIPVVVFSADGSAAAPPERIAARLRKPLRAEDLLRAVAELVG